MRIVIAGYVNVGRSLHELIEGKREEVRSRYSLDLRVVAVVDRGGAAVDERGLKVDEVARAKAGGGTVASVEGIGRPGATAGDVLSDVEAEVYVDATVPNFRDGQPALSYIEGAITRRMHVVTSNKAPLAIAMPALVELASYRGVKLMYSGSVGGGTPFLSFASKSLRGNRVLWVRGVLNGTVNFVLYRMEEGRGLEEALEEAKRLGYAEADPSVDLSGLDAAAKLVILTNHVMGSKYTLRDTKYSGLEGVGPEDVMRARDRGRALRLIADSRRLQVRLEEVERESPLCVPLNLNAVEFSVEELGSVFLMGKGAGGRETAAAMLRDLIELSYRRC